MLLLLIKLYMHSYLKKKKEKLELHELVKLYQLHWKYENEACRFKFGKFFSKETLVSEPLPESIPE